MNSRFENLTKFFETFIGLSFWRRVFEWRHVRVLSYSAYEEYKSLTNTIDRIADDLQQSKSTASLATSENEHLREHQATLEKELRSTISHQTSELNQLKQRMEEISNQRTTLQRDYALLRQSEETRLAEYEKKVSTLSTIQQRLLDERKREQDEHSRVELEKLTRMKESWSRHQDRVKNVIRTICQKHNVEYVESVPFKGTPDNTIRIGDEYVVFDAKSPASDDLSNFPHYIKTQAEVVRKYAREEGVRKDLFLVVPSNTTEVLGHMSYNLADYNVYIVAVDALEPIILSLKRLEEYEFVDQLSPEERDDICRLIGKFAHIAKRRIQVDHFFAWEFLDVLTRCKTALPQDMMEQVMVFERSEKLNPPQERRAKQILIQDLETDVLRIQKEAEAKSIVFPPSMKEELRGLPLFEGDQS